MIEDYTVPNMLGIVIIQERGIPITTLSYRGFHKWGSPKCMVYNKTSLNNWMIWGYPYFRNPPICVNIGFQENLVIGFYAVLVSLQKRNKAGLGQAVHVAPEVSCLLYSVIYHDLIAT